MFIVQPRLLGGGQQTVSPGVRMTGCFWVEASCVNLTRVTATRACRGDARQGTAGQQALTSPQAKFITSLIELNVY